MYQKYFTHFLKGHEGFQHLAAHSHYFWPDVARAAHLQYWDDSAKMSDQKWDHIFSLIIPQAQKHIARILNLKKSEMIAFAPNTHEFVVRLLSCLDYSSDVRILTTDSEFYSFNRQIGRTAELNKVELVKVPTENFSNFEERFIAEAKKLKPHFIFFSQVFFNSGVECDYKKIIREIRSLDSIIVLDSYHGFAALPTDLAEFEGRIFVTAGGYKYAMSGEGVCFLVMPENHGLRPLSTGWLADFAGLEGKQSLINYSNNGMSFFGATFDPSGLYRFNAVMDLWIQEKLETKVRHDYVRCLQNRFLARLSDFNLRSDQLIWNGHERHGHFFTFEFKTIEAAKNYVDDLAQKKILVDRRGSRVRFGFGIYQN